MIDWKIRSRSSKCQACENAFTDGQSYHTLLFAEKAEHQRIDVCRDCWEDQYGQGASDRKGFISHWSGTFQVPPPPPPEPLQKESAETALRKLVEIDAANYGPVCFILGAMLERKRILKVREEIHDGEARGFVYEHAKTGDIFSIWDPRLKLDELEDIQRDVAELLEGGVDAFLRHRDPNGEETDNPTAGEGATSRDADETIERSDGGADERDSTGDSMTPDDNTDSSVATGVVVSK